MISLSHLVYQSINPIAVGLTVRTLAGANQAIEKKTGNRRIKGPAVKVNPVARAEKVPARATKGAPAKAKAEEAWAKAKAKHKKP